jgi:hypothetical protein
MNLDDFHRLFGDNVRALVSWGHLEAAGATISEHIVTDSADLGRLRTVWYRSPAGDVGDWRDPGSVPQSVSEAVAERDIWAPGRSDRVEMFRREFSRYTEPILMTIPAYQTPFGALMLDATHRAVAAYLSGAEVRLLVLAIDGPIDSEILPDLTHHAANEHLHG